MTIDDEILPSNRGPWRVSYCPEGVQVERVTLEICTWTSISIRRRG